MKFSYTKQLKQRKAADLLVLPFWKDKQGALVGDPIFEELSPFLQGILATKDFKGREEEVVYLYVEGQPEKRFALLGLGKQDSTSMETLRRCYGALTKSCLARQIKSLNVIIPTEKKLKEEELIRAISEGLFLPNSVYHGSKHLTSDEQKDVLIKEINWIGNGHQKKILDTAKKYDLICQGVEYSRQLVNGNADDITPEYLGKCALDLAKKFPSIKATVFDKKRIQKEKLDLILAVNRGSSNDPAFIVMEFRGNPQSTEHTVLVGKGVTYDTGGLNLKPTGLMETMKCDMAGGAVCFGVIWAASQLKLKVNLTVVIPSTENCIDANSFKPGDVYKSYSGKSVEMTNSDAEGRLILADALSYAIKNLHPTRLLDIATLTGAIEVALGTEASGVMGNDLQLIDGLVKAGSVTFERLWHMPLFPEYKDRLKSDIADLKSWNGRSAGANVAAMFLYEFVGDTVPWAHIDIAGTAYNLDGKKYLPKYASGFGVRLILELLA